MSDKFDILRWQGTIDRAIRGFSRIDEILRAADLDKYTSEIKDPPKDSPHAGLLTALNRIQKEDHLITFEQARSLYRRQMIVHAVTLAESMIKDLTVQLFIRHPERMTSFVGHRTDVDSTQGSVSFRLILQAKSKSDLIAGLAREASTRVAGKLKEKRFSRLERVGKHKLPDDLKDQLIEIIDLRNRIIHEHSDEDVITQKVVNTYEAILKRLSTELETIANKNSIPTDREELLTIFDELKKQKS